MRGWLAVVGLALVAGCIKSPTPTLVPIPAQEPQMRTQVSKPYPCRRAGVDYEACADTTHTDEWKIATERIKSADGIILGTIAKLDEDWTYDDPCGLVTILMKNCNGTVTYSLKVKSDSSEQWLWTFVLAYGTFGLWRGQPAIFVWHDLYIPRLFECKQRLAGGAGGMCAVDKLQTLTSDLDVLPLADSTRVDSIFASVGKRRKP